MQVIGLCLFSVSPYLSVQFIHHGDCMQGELLGINLESCYMQGILPVVVDLAQLSSRCHNSQTSKANGDAGKDDCCVPLVRKIGFLCLLAMSIGSEMARLF
jgi:hypothetical protein